MHVTRYSDDVIQAQHDGIMHRSLMISFSICTQFVPLMFCNDQILDHFFKHLRLRVITLRNYDVILKAKCKVRLRNLPTFSSALNNGKNYKGSHKVLYTQYADIKLRFLR